MKNARIKLYVVISLILTSAFTLTDTFNWKVKEGFKIKCLDAGGEFTGLKASIFFDEDNPSTSNILAVINANSLELGNYSANEKAKLILESYLYTTIVFKSLQIEKIGTGKYNMLGELTIKGITKEIKFQFYFDSKVKTERCPKQTFYATFAIPAKQFNIEWNNKEKLSIELIIPVTK